jgi:arylformamidase
MWDITVPIDEAMALWPGSRPPSQRWVERLSAGDLSDVSEWTLDAHTGTHLDAPSHFLPGAADLEALGLSALVGPCAVVAYPALAPAERLLVKLPPSSGLSLADAQWLIAHDVRLVGVDALSVETEASVDAGAPVHRTLLGAGVAILESLALESVPPGPYELIALPLRLQHAEASPVRAILLPAH